MCLCCILRAVYLLFPSPSQPALDELDFKKYEQEKSIFLSLFFYFCERLMLHSSPYLPTFPNKIFAVCEASPVLSFYDIRAVARDRPVATLKVEIAHILC